VGAGAHFEPRNRAQRRVSGGGRGWHLACASGSIARPFLLAAMLKNYLVIALRNLRRRKGYTALNVVGLALGLACAFFILLWITNEVRYDRFHENGDDLYRVMRHAEFGGQVQTWGAVPTPLAEVLEADYPEVEHATLLSWPVSPLIARGDAIYRGEGYYAGPAFFETFSFPLLAGDPTTALDDPASIVISQSLAAKVFGPDWTADEVLGQALTVEHRKDFRITGISAAVTEPTVFRFDFILPVEDYIARNEWTEHWYNAGLEIYAELRPGASAAALDAKIAGVINEHHEDANGTPFLQPVADMRLWGLYEDGELAGGRIEYVRILGVVAVFLLLIAAINFMNLATARSAQRAREIGVRKALGAAKGALVRQFLVETVVLALAAFAVALGLVAVLLPTFNDLVQSDLALGDLPPSTYLIGVGIAIVTGLFAGSYPALYLSSFSPVAVLRGTFRQGRGEARFREGLVVFQFALSTLLIVGTLTVYLQMDYVREKNLGLDRANVVSMRVEGPARDQFASFRQELMSRPGISSVTASNQNPLNVGNSTTNPAWTGKPEDDNTLFYVINTRHDFVETMDMELVAGRAFSRDFASDSANVIINERAAEAMGLEDPVGQDLALWGREGQIVGVVRDFHIRSLYTPIEPTILRLEAEYSDFLYVRTAAGETATALASLESVYGQFNPGYPFETEFLDEEYEQMYQGELVVGTLANIFTGIAIFIACLGLFGLAAYTAERRRKEIGVRKVLGASVGGVVALLSRDFVRLVVIGFALAAPLGWWVMNRWLDDFAYRVDLGVGVFLVAGVAALVIALATVSGQALRAATADPVDALRSE
jgi:predicted permease